MVLIPQVWESHIEISGSSEKWLKSLAEQQPVDENQISNSTVEKR
jgi:hypothetical protein